MENQPVEPAFEVPSRLIPLLRVARHLAVLTGAGISAESGVPTFREAQTSLWAQYDPLELATPEAFARNPKLVWEWYAWRRELVSAAHPNPGHLALAEIERRLSSQGQKFTLITQNVDSLHRRAGSRNVIELHGNLRRTRCWRENIVIDEWADSGDVPPRCPRCGAHLRPDVVWFNEAMPAEAWRAASEAAWACDLFFSIGTSAVVQPAASLPFRALERGVVVVEINLQPTPLSQAASPPSLFTLRGPAGAILPALTRAAWPA